MTELTELLDITTNENGDIFMYGTQVRVLKGSPDMVAVVDSIGALRKTNYENAKKQLNRLLKDHPELRDKVVSIDFRGKGGVKSQAATINNLVYIIGKLKGPVAALFAQKGADAWTRILGGDQTLHAEVDACREEQERLAVEDPSNPMRLFGKYIEDKTIGNLTVAQYAPIWKKKRDIQKTVTKQLNEAITTVGFKQPAEYAKFIGIQGLSDEQFGNKIHKLEIEERKTNKRVLLLEKKKQLAIEAKRPRPNPIASLFAKRVVVAV